MKRREFIAFLGSVAIVAPRDAIAQTPSSGLEIDHQFELGRLRPCSSRSAPAIEAPPKRRQISSFALK
jgi:hypothetical protein